MSMRVFLTVTRGLVLTSGLALFCAEPVIAQPLQRSAPAAAAPSRSAPIDKEKQKAIQELLQAINVDRLVDTIGKGLVMQAKQLVPAILSEALFESKKFTEAQKRALVPQLQQNAVPKLIEQAGGVFASSNFRKQAIKVQQQAYADHYTAAEIRDLTRFYQSHTGKKYIETQDTVGRQIVNELIEKFMSQAIKATREQADREVSNAKLGSGGAKAAGK